MCPPDPHYKAGPDAVMEAPAGPLIEGVPRPMDKLSDPHYAADPVRDALAALAAFNVDNAEDAIRLLAMWRGTDQLDDDARAAVLAHYTKPCQPWCVWPGRSCGGECLSEGTVVAATAGVQVIAEYGMRVPRMEANTIITESGAPAVSLSIHGPINEDDDRAAWGYLTPAEARRLAAVLLAEADRAEADAR